MSKLAQLRALREAKFDRPTKAPEREPVITNVTNVTNVTNAPKKMSAVERSLKWRSENPERYRATQRALMRKKRATSNVSA